MNDRSKFWMYAAQLVVLAMLSVSCSSILFEQPVPQKASVLKTIPDYLSGLYNAITPFKKDGESNSYLVNPTDAHLEKLLADPYLFSSMKLKKLF